MPIKRPHPSAHHDKSNVGPIYWATEGAIARPNDLSCLAFSCLRTIRFTRRSSGRPRAVMNNAGPPRFMLAVLRGSR